MPSVKDYNNVNTKISMHKVHIFAFKLSKCVKFYLELSFFFSFDFFKQPVLAPTSDSFISSLDRGD